MVSTAAFHARVRGSVPGLGGLKETKMFLPHPRVKVSIVGSLRDREVACSASDRQGSNFESCVWRTVSFQSSHHPQEVLLAQFSLYVHKGGLKPDSFHFIKASIHDKIDSVAEDMKKNIVNDKLGQLHPRIRGLETIQRAQEPYATEVSIVAFNVPFTTEENILATVEHMLHDTQDGLGLRDIRVIIRAKRTPMRNRKPGIVKVELSNLDDKKFVLRAKTNLRNTVKYKKVYMRDFIILRVNASCLSDCL